VATATVAMLATTWLATTQRNAVAAEGDAFVDEQRIADQIVALTYQQQLAAYRYLQSRDASDADAFHRSGESAYAGIRQYLFHDLSPEARLEVERIKEIHQDYEVAAQRAFELAQRGREAEARTRLADLGTRTATLDSAVGQFLLARARQRDEFLERDARIGAVLEGSQLLAAALLVLLVLLLSRQIHRRMLLPLDQLADTARRLGKGDQGARMSDQVYAELDAVASSFNRMADDIQLARELVEAQNEELLQTLDQLRQTLDDLQRTQGDLVQHEKLSAMGEMLAGLAHELNNPLAGVLGMAEVVRDELADSPHADLRAMAGELADPLVHEALRARSLVANLLNFARKPSGELVPVPLADTVGAAVGLSAHTFTMAGKTLRVDVDRSLHVLANAQTL
jgi:C4-dicarboxylate-specific signal transduction histidine kinase